MTALDKIRILQLGYEDWTGRFPLPENISLLYEEVLEQAPEKPFDLVFLDRAPLPEEIMQFVNRLSDLLFTMARYEMFQQDHAEERWNSFLYKRKKKE